MQLFDRMLASLILALDGDNDPIVEDVEHLEGLAGDFVQDQTCPGEKQVEAHGEILTLLGQHSSDLLIQRQYKLLTEECFNLGKDGLSDLEQKRA